MAQHWKWVMGLWVTAQLMTTIGLHIEANHDMPAKILLWLSPLLMPAPIVGYTGCVNLMMLKLLTQTFEIYFLAGNVIVFCICLTFILDDWQIAPVLFTLAPPAFVGVLGSDAI